MLLPIFSPVFLCDDLLCKDNGLGCCWGWLLQSRLIFTGGQHCKSKFCLRTPLLQHTVRILQSISLVKYFLPNYSILETWEQTAFVLHFDLFYQRHLPNPPVWCPTPTPEKERSLQRNPSHQEKILKKWIKPNLQSSKMKQNFNCCYPHPLQNMLNSEVHGIAIALTIGAGQA